MENKSVCFPCCKSVINPREWRKRSELYNFSSSVIYLLFCHCRRELHFNSQTWTHISGPPIPKTYTHISIKQRGKNPRNLLTQIVINSKRKNVMCCLPFQITELFPLIIGIVIATYNHKITCY